LLPYKPPSVRDFVTFESHVEGVRRSVDNASGVPDAWYDAPTFYFTNPHALYGPGAAIPRPVTCRALDFELEVGVVLGSGGSSLSLAEAEDAIFGYTIVNDWSARDLQSREMQVGLGPAKGKDFALSLGPWLLTADEVPLADGRVDVEATATVNGEQLTKTWAGAQYFPWSDLVAHAARNTRLRPGDVLGSGTLNRGCLLELGPLPGDRWLEPGDTVALEAGPLGRLENRIV
jgi:2-keto-4-pentenoate hydratase/2-oxohepta-3-ene-1,7-dioic acid hydratase in catechol pathway